MVRCLFLPDSHQLLIEDAFGKAAKTNTFLGIYKLI